MLESRDHQQIYISNGVLDLTFAFHARGWTLANVKSTPLGFLNLVLGDEYIPSARVYPWIGGEAHEPICDPAVCVDGLRDRAGRGSRCDAGRSEPKAYAYQEASTALAAPLLCGVVSGAGAARVWVLRAVPTGLSRHWPELRLQDMAASLCGRSRSENLPVLGPLKADRTSKPNDGARLNLAPRCFAMFASAICA